MRDTIKFTVAAIIILAVALFSGCVTSKTCPVVVSQTDGLTISRIEPSYYQIPVGDKIKVYMDVQNRGNSQAQNVKAALWAHAGFRLTTCDTELKSTPKTTLEPPRLDICSEGEVYTFQWELKAGCDPVETILAIYLDYDYNSQGYAKIPMASQGQYERNQGKGFTAKSENFPSAGPIQVKIEPIELEPVLISNEEGARDFSVRLLFNNIGPGLVGPKGVGELGETELKISGPCVFSKRNAATRENEELGVKMYYDTDDSKEIPIFKKTNDPNVHIVDDAVIGQIQKQEIKSKRMVWLEAAVVMKSGTQESMKIAYLEYEGDPSMFVEDICRIDVSSDYHYQTVESPSKKMGVYGSPSQVEACLSEPAPSPEDCKN